MQKLDIEHMTYLYNRDPEESQLSDLFETVL